MILFLTQKMRWQLSVSIIHIRLHLLLLDKHTDFQSSCSSGSDGLQIGVLFSQDLFNSPAHFQLLYNTGPDSVSLEL
jgi:hypothetical protein